MNNETAGKPSYPDSREIILIAREAMQSQDWLDALEHWNLCIQVFDDETHPGWHAARARVLLSLDRLEEATRALEALARDQPEFSPQLMPNWRHWRSNNKTGGWRQAIGKSAPLRRRNQDLFLQEKRW